METVFASFSTWYTSVFSDAKEEISYCCEIFIEGLYRDDTLFHIPVGFMPSPSGAAQARPAHQL
jgi:hypothetical protein